MYSKPRAKWRGNDGISFLYCGYLLRLCAAGFGGYPLPPLFSRKIFKTLKLGVDLKGKIFKTKELA